MEIHIDYTITEAERDRMVNVLASGPLPARGDDYRLLGLGMLTLEGSGEEMIVDASNDARENFYASDGRIAWPVVS